MIYSLRIKEEALEDLQQAYSYYEENRTGLGEDFLLSVEASFNRISRYPKSFRVRYKKFRADWLNRFPYLIIFRIEEYEVVVFKVYHTSRNPSIWKKL